MKDENTCFKFYMNYYFSFGIATVIYVHGRIRKWNLSYNLQGKCYLAESGLGMSISNRRNNMGENLKWDVMKPQGT